MNLVAHMVMLITIFAEPWRISSETFKGGIMMMRPLPDNPQQVELSFHVSWRRESNEGGYCDQTIVDNGNIIGNGSIQCSMGCSGTIADMRYQCTDFSIQEDWSYGQRTIPMTVTSTTLGFYFNGTHDFNGNETQYYLSFQNSMYNRSDNGLYNSSPRSINFPVIRIQEGCSHVIRIPTIDPDGDLVRCFWAYGSQECGTMCDLFPGANLDYNCTVTYLANRGLGYKAATIIMSDYGYNLPSSRIGLHFPVLVYASDTPCQVKPVFLEPTLQDGQCIDIAAGETFQTKIVAYSGETGTEITEFQTVSPLGLHKGPVVQEGGSGSWTYSTEISWTPTEYQRDYIGFFCFTALNRKGKASEQRCIHLTPRSPRPQIVSISQNHDVVNSSKIYWEIDFNIPVQKTMYLNDVEFHDGLTTELICSAYDSSFVLSPYNGATRAVLDFQRNTCRFVHDRPYYVNIPRGTFFGLRGCSNEMLAISDSFWTFTFKDTTPPSIDIHYVSSYYTRGDVSIKWSVTEPSTVTCTLQHGYPDPEYVTVANCINNEWNETKLPDNIYGFNITAVDIGGNAKTTVLRIEVDSIAPVIGFLSVPEPFSTGINMNFVFEMDDAYTLNITITNKNRTVYSRDDYTQSSLYLLGQQGDHGLLHTISVTPTDRTGNIGRTISYSWTIDREPPVLSRPSDIVVNCTIPSLDPKWTGTATATEDVSDNYTVTYGDRWFHCYLERNWTAEDSAGNGISSMQKIQIESGMVVDYTRDLQIPCDSSNFTVDSVPSKTANATQVCFPDSEYIGFIKVDSVDPSQYQCPSTFVRNYTVVNICTEERVNFLQTITLNDVCSNCHVKTMAGNGMVN